MINVVSEQNLGNTLKKNHLVASKLDVNIDNISIVTDINGKLSAKLNVVGQFAGVSSTFIGLPLTTIDGNPINNNDWAILNADNGLNQAGIYIYNGVTYVMVMEIPEPFVLNPSTLVSPKSDNNIGIVGVSLKYAREDHKHPAQLPSVNTDNMIVTGTDSLHYLPLESIKNLATVEVKDFFGVRLGSMFP